MKKMLVSNVTQEDFISVRYNFYQSTVKHSHNFFELMYVVEGSLVHRVNSLEERVMKTGDYMIMDIGTIHEYTGDNLKLINASFLPQAIEPELKDCKTLTELLKYSLFDLKEMQHIPFPVNIILHDTDGSILSVIEAMASVQGSSKKLSDKVSIHLLVSLLLQILNTQDAVRFHNSTTEITSYILETIKKQYADDNLLVTAAHELNYSLSYLSYTFKRDMGVSFKEYLQKYRADVAAKLLESSDNPIYEISNAVGYSDLKSFNRIFKSHIKMTPSKYRKIKKLSKQLETDIAF
ncbi:MAG: helix-turn-helix domain-containing protein [Clostridia bacterium]|nr:helix-turn-helix domain-containing protein [Clostridia bacterium]